MDDSLEAYREGVSTLWAILAYGIDLGPYSSHEGVRCSDWRGGDGVYARNAPRPSWAAARRVCELAASLFYLPDVWPFDEARPPVLYAWWVKSRSKEMLSRERPQSEREVPPFGALYDQHWHQSLTCRGYLPSDDSYYFGLLRAVDWGGADNPEEYLRRWSKQLGGWRDLILEPHPVGTTAADVVNKTLSGEWPKFRPLSPAAAVAALREGAASLATLWWIRAISWGETKLQPPIPLDVYVQAIDAAEKALSPKPSNIISLKKVVAKAPPKVKAFKVLDIWDAIDVSPDSVVAESPAPGRRGSRSASDSDPEKAGAKGGGGLLLAGAIGAALLVLRKK